MVKNRTGETKDLKNWNFDASPLSIQHIKDWLDRNQENVADEADMSTCGLLLQ